MHLDKSVYKKFKAPVIAKEVSVESSNIAQQVIEAMKPLIKDVINEAIGQLKQSGQVLSTSK